MMRALLFALAFIACERKPVVETLGAPVAIAADSALPGLAQLASDEREPVLATIRLIDSKGPFPFPEKDGSVFGNYEGRLPDEPRGYYHEYTVPTPGRGGRGARRLVAGERRELYYTRDHYETFVLLTRPAP